MFFVLVALAPSGALGAHGHAGRAACAGGGYPTPPHGGFLSGQRPCPGTRAGSGTGSTPGTWAAARAAGPA